MEDCPLCRAGTIGREWSRKVLTAKTSPTKCATEWGMTVAEVYEHINTHEIVADKETGDTSSPDFYMGKLLKMLRFMEDWINLVTEQSDGFDVNKMRAAATVIREIRETLKTLAEFQGLRDSGVNYTAQITLIKQQYMVLTTAVMEEVCDECRGRILNVIEAMPPMLTT